jgi:hypothetical protein
MVTKQYKDEQWKPIWFEGIHPEEKYEVSNYGRIRRWKEKRKDFKILSTSNQRADGTGYDYFRFKRDDNQLSTKSVHRLVALAFVSKPSPDHDFVCHKDFNKGNNKVENISWVTRSELVAHNQKNPKVIAGHAKTKGLIRRSKLTENDVIRLKKKLKRGKNKLYLIAKEFGITHTQLNRIRKGENWGHIKIDED